LGVIVERREHKPKKQKVSSAFEDEISSSNFKQSLDLQKKIDKQHFPKTHGTFKSLKKYKRRK